MFKKRLENKIIHLCKTYGFDDCMFTKSSNEHQTILLLFKQYSPSKIDKQANMVGVDEYYICSNQAYHACKELCNVIFEQYGIHASHTNEIKYKQLTKKYGGKIGLNSLYYHDKFGSYVSIQAITLDNKFVYKKQIESTKCELCYRCVSACPTMAIDKQGFHREKCLRNMLDHDIPCENRHQLIQLFGCNLCQICCPMNFKKTKIPTSFHINDLLSGNLTKHLKNLCGSNYASRTRIITQALCFITKKNIEADGNLVQTLIKDKNEKISAYAKWAHDQVKNKRQ